MRIDSIITLVDIFDCPYLRSVKTIGISTTLSPARAARNAISTMNE